MFRKIIVGFVIVVAGLQFIPKKLDNRGKLDTAAAIDVVYPVPDSVMVILKSSCYDCHSNATAYPWYASIQPLSMWINHHVNEGKGELNFSEFGNYRIAKQFHKLHEIEEQVEEGEMPLSSYTLIHRKAKLSDSQKNLIFNWSKQLQDTLKSRYPADSLVMKRKGH